MRRLSLIVPDDENQHSAQVCVILPLGFDFLLHRCNPLGMDKESVVLNMTKLIQKVIL